MYVWRIRMRCRRCRGVKRGRSLGVMAAKGGMPGVSTDDGVAPFLGEDQVGVKGDAAGELGA